MGKQTGGMLYFNPNNAALFNYSNNRMLICIISVIRKKAKVALKVLSLQKKEEIIKHWRFQPTSKTSAGKYPQQMSVAFKEY